MVRIILLAWGLVDVNDQELVVVNSGSVVDQGHSGGIGSNLALPSMKREIRHRMNPAALYLAKLNSHASIKTMRSHLNWIVRTIAAETGYDLEAKIESKVLHQNPGTEKEETDLRECAWSSVYSDFDWHTLYLEHLRGLVNLKKQAYTHYRGQV